MGRAIRLNACPSSRERLVVFRVCAAALVAALHIGCWASPKTDATALSGSQDSSSIYVEVCLPDRKAIVEETTVDATEVPENLPQEEWQDMLLKATVTGRYERGESVSRAMVTVRAARPADGPDAAERLLGMGEVAIARGVGSVGSNTLRLSDITELDQPVYHSMTNKLEGELVALNVERHRERGGVKEMITYWFKPPQRIRGGSYTEWKLPIRQDRPREPGAPNVGISLLDRKDLPTGAVDNFAPRIRYTLLAWEEYARRSQPRARALRVKALREATGAGSDVGVPRGVRGTIPGC